MSKDIGRQERKEFRLWGLSTLWLTALFFIVLGVIVFALNSAGVIGRTIVERAVFEQSYQRSAAEEARLNTFTAELAGIEARLGAGNLTDVQRDDLSAQAAALRIQINQMEQ